MIDVNGWFTDATTATGYRYVAASPTRICDTRTTSRSGITDTCTGQTLGSTNTTTANDEVLKVTAGGMSGIPANAQALVVNLTAVSPSDPGYVTAYPDGLATAPTAADLNFVPGEVVPNLSVVQLSAAGALDVFNYAGTVDLVADAQGWYQ